MPKSEACFHLRNCLEAGKDSICPSYLPFFNYLLTQGLWEISSPLASDVGPGSTDEVHLGGTGMIFHKKIYDFFSRMVIWKAY